MNENNLISSFFIDQEEYVHFLVMSSELMKANDEATCMAQISKDGAKFLYKLTWLPDGKFIGDYVKPFRATVENIQTFNKGCEILAERLNHFIHTNDSSKISSEPPAFGNLTQPIHN